MDGFEFLWRFRSEGRHREIPVIIWTAKDLTAEEDLRLRANVQAVHSKFGGNLAGLLEDIRRVLPPIVRAGKGP